MTKIALTEVSINTTVGSNPKKIIIPPEPNSIKRKRAFCIIPNMKKNKTIRGIPPAKYRKPKGVNPVEESKSKPRKL